MTTEYFLALLASKNIHPPLVEGVYIHQYNKKWAEGKLEDKLKGFTFGKIRTPRLFTEVNRHHRTDAWALVKIIQDTFMMYPVLWVYHLDVQSIRFSPVFSMGTDKELFELYMNPLIDEYGYLSIEYLARKVQ